MGEAATLPAPDPRNKKRAEEPAASGGRSEGQEENKTTKRGLLTGGRKRDKREAKRAEGRGEEAVAGLFWPTGHCGKASECGSSPHPPSSLASHPEEATGRESVASGMIIDRVRSNWKTLPTRVYLLFNVRSTRSSYLSPRPANPAFRYEKHFSDPVRFQPGTPGVLEGPSIIFGRCSAVELESLDVLPSVRRRG